MSAGQSASPPSAITFRPIAAGDEAFLFSVYASTRADELAPVPWSEEQKRAFLGMQFQAQHRFYLENFPACDYLVVLRDGRPAGRLYVDRRPDEIRLIDIALLPEHRGAGIGTALLRQLFAEATAAAKPLRIHVERFNPALRLYSRLGFTQVADEGVYLLMEWRPGEAPG
ncbi:MAG TPA: GNAT family N-acetyltransferase [Thermoanaerobaculia bacterium]|nr:GNAT family N-acetyltransferase [Thermoanaerobaculia bacterium]